MNTTWPLWLVCFLLLFLAWQNQRRFVIQRQIKRKKTEKERDAMRELAKRFIGKKCIVDTIKSDNVTGTLQEVTEGGLLVEDNLGNLTAVNLDLVVRVREYPKNKKGKEKSVILDGWLL